MSTEYPKDQPGEPCGEVTVKLVERGGSQVVLINNSDQALELAISALPELTAALTSVEQESPAQETPADLNGRVGFAHPSEEELARILDFYHIRWVYEARTFPLDWDGDGRVVSSITPDFYLPDHDLFIELTTLRQPLVTRKNRKVRRLRELYPEINIKVLYASDFRKLIEKFVASGSWQGANGDKNNGPE